MIEILLAFFFISVLLFFLGSGIWVAISMVGVSSIGMILFTSRPVGDAMATTIWGASSSWTLDDLTKVARISGRLGKYLLAEITEPPSADDLKVLRTAGINGLVLDVSAGKDALESLKASLMEMPKAGPEKSGRSNAILPGAAYSAQEEEEAGPEHEEDDDE